jgi:poly-gamma-glutamate capsule biosynthesis protein CapA/YwtB (metallophosphatase superfamily)
MKSKISNTKRMKLNSMAYSTLLTLFIFSAASFSLSGQTISNPGNRLSLLFIGDIMGHDEQIWSAENRETHKYNYDEVFKYIKPVLSEADIAIANFEVTLAGPPYMGYPRFSSPAELAVSCRNAGIDYFVTANNHAADRGNQGIISTINKLDSIGIPHTGTFLNSACRDTLSPLMINRNGFSIALLNYTFSTNGIKVPAPVIVNMLDKTLITEDIRKARNKNADIIILFLHWGTEYDSIPSAAQTDLAKYFFSTGVDLVIGSHPHVLQKMVWSKSTGTIKDGLVVYSLGNFISNQRKPKTDGGSIVRIEFTRVNNSVKISNAGYYLTWVYTPIEKYRKRFFILPCSEFENNPGFFTNPADFTMMKKFITDSRELLYKQNVEINEYKLNEIPFNFK